jgi:eukaryotic-like serine/threonine-protein kinase
MLGPPGERNLLFGIVALRMKLISHAELVQATREWVRDDTRTLGQVLLAQNSISDQESTLIDALVERQLEESDDDIERSLARLSPGRGPAMSRVDGASRSYGEREMESSHDAADVDEWARALEPLPKRHATEFLDSHLIAALSPKAASPVPGESIDAPDRERRQKAFRESAPLAGSRYQTLWAHASGGLGEIFIAEDGELRRQVALKVIQQQHARNPVSRERFIAEAEITGNLEHPGIVPVYGLGSYVDGRPCYAMRFIKGEDLATAARRFHTGTSPDFQGREFRWILQRFIDVCNPIAYAHSRGVVHRDLKPSNIMLGPFGETLVMDWGLAKVVHQSESGQTATDESTGITDQPTMGAWLRENSVTIAGQTVGTPAYMSPEQAAGRLHAIGPQSDVYSLGATLYVLLTDRRPFDGESQDVFQAVQDGRFRAPREIKPRVPKALDAVCLRAMSREPSNRYPSALALAEDIERWLADEPVSAWDEPWIHWARRWVRRHHSLVAGWAAAVVVALLALGMAVPLLSLAWGNESVARWNERQLRILALQKAAEAQDQRMEAISNLEAASRERARAIESETAAKEDKDRAEKALSLLVEAFRRPDPSIDGRSVKIVDLLDRSVRELETSLRSQPLMEATLLSAIGETFSGLGMTHEALDAFKRAVELRRKRLGEYHPDTLKALHNLAMAHQDAGRLDEAIPILEATLAQRTAKLGDDHDDVIESTNDLAVAYWESGQAVRSISFYNVALAKVRAKHGEDHESTLTIMDNLGVACVAAGDPDRAIALHESVLARMRVKLGDDQLATLVTMNNLARAYEAGGKIGRSIELYESTVPKMQNKLGDDHRTTLTAMCGLARAYQAGGRLNEAVSLYEDTLAKQKAKLGADHLDSLLTAFHLAGAYQAAGEFPKAMRLSDAFLERTQSLSGRLPARIRELIPAVTKLRQALAEDSGRIQSDSPRH